MALIRAPRRPSDLTPKENFLRKAMDRFNTVVNSESKLRQDMLEDFEFRYDDQWPIAVRREREADGRPCLTINRIPQFITQVTNQERNLRPAIQVNPIDSAADVATAEALQGVIRNIETNSDSDVAYSTACEHQVTAGRGYWRVFTKFAGDDGFEQVIVIDRILNPFSVYVDPSHTTCDASDARYGFIVEDIPLDDFIELYGNDKYTNLSMRVGAGNSISPNWMPTGSVRVAEYFYMETKVIEMVEIEFPDPETGVRSTIRLTDEQIPNRSDMPEDWRIVGSRKVSIDKVKWAKITPVDILEGNEDLTEGQDFPSRYIPIIQVLGHESNINGKRNLRGMVRGAKDPQRMYSFWASALTEVIAMTPRSPYIGVEGQFTGHEAKWNTANRKNYAYLEVKNIAHNGQFVGLPQRQNFEPAIAAIVQAFQLADNDLKAVMGLYDASLGQQGPEQSGTAILARQRQGEIGNANYLDNMGRGIRHGGRVVLSMIPEVYTPIRILKILGVDDKPQTVLLSNGAPKEDTDAIAAAQGIPNIYDISVGRYDVSISSGSSHPSRRQETALAMLELVKTNPELMQYIGDLLVGTMDWPKAPEIAARLRRLVSPQILGEEPQVPPETQQELDQIKEQFQLLQAEYQKVQTELATRQAELESKERNVQAGIKSREQIAQFAGKIDLLIAQSKADSEKEREILRAEIGQLQKRLDNIHEFNLEAARHAADVVNATHEANIAASTETAQPAE